MRLAFVVFAATLSFGLAACPPNEPPAPPPSPPNPVYSPPDGGAVTPIVQAPTIDAAPAARAPGASCTTAADCDSGICEGEGCDAPGRCADKRRMCTMDLIDMCGCDGQTFQSSSSCPGRRFAHRGACTPTNQGPPPPPANQKKHAGEACLAGDDCDSGLCEGEGCGADAPGRCADVAKKCTRDRRPFCGCDNQTFMTSGTCPGRRYAHKGKC
ncbi:MAG TPA: hypothetical protein VL463_11020 [Kofleriaceae bacterium]|jgi:hypothetical protein|nr:hypothetical protein [Kofleriaceae bacterium]